MRYLTGVTVLLLLVLGGVAQAANVDVILDCSCSTNLDPTILDVGDTLTFTCPAEACAPPECIVFHNGGSISGITPFAQFIPTGETGSPLGPATAGGEYAVAFVMNDLCFPSFHIVLKTTPDVSAVTPPGVVAAVILMLVAGFVVSLRKRPSWLPWNDTQPPGGSMAP